MTGNAANWSLHVGRPVILPGVAVLVDQASPLSLREEQEQLEPGS